MGTGDGRTSPHWRIRGGGGSAGCVLQHTADKESGGCAALGGLACRSRDYHSAAPPSPSSRRFNSNGDEQNVSKMAEVSAGSRVAAVELVHEPAAVWTCLTICGLPLLWDAPNTCQHSTPVDLDAQLRVASGRTTWKGCHLAARSSSATSRSIRSSASFRDSSVLPSICSYSALNFASTSPAFSIIEQIPTLHESAAFGAKTNGRTARNLRVGDCGLFYAATLHGRRPATAASFARPSPTRRTCSRRAGARA